jgi:hypothetical protein
MNVAEVLLRRFFQLNIVSLVLQVLAKRRQIPDILAGKFQSTLFMEKHASLPLK